MKKGIRIAFAMIMSSLMLFAGCSSSSSSPSSSTSSAPAATTASASASAPAASASAEKTVDMSGVTLRVQYTFPADSKLLELAGLSTTPYKLELISYTGSNLALQAIASDNLDLARSSEIPPLYASLTNGGGNFSIIANEKMYLGYQALVVGPDSTIKSVADLKGQKVGYVQQTSSQYFLAKMLSQAGLSWSDVQAVNLSTADGLSALMGGQIAAMAEYGNTVTACVKSGGKILQSADNILSGNTYWEANKKSLQDAAKCAAMVDYLKRTEQLEAWVRTHHQEYADKMADKYYGMTVPDFIKYLEAGEKIRENHVLVYTDADISALQDISDTFSTIGALEKKVDVKPLFDSKLSTDITAALKSITK